MKESWDEELRRSLYDCLCQSYDYAFKKKTLDVQTPSEIVNVIETIIIRLKSYNASRGLLMYLKLFYNIDSLTIFII